MARSVWKTYRLVNEPYENLQNDFIFFTFCKCQSPSYITYTKHYSLLWYVPCGLLHFLLFESINTATLEPEFLSLLMYFRRRVLPRFPLKPFNKEAQWWFNHTCFMYITNSYSLDFPPSACKL